MGFAHVCATLSQSSGDGGAELFRADYSTLCSAESSVYILIDVWPLIVYSAVSVRRNFSFIRPPLGVQPDGDETEGVGQSGKLFK